MLQIAETRNPIVVPAITARRSDGEANLSDCLVVVASLERAKLRQLPRGQNAAHENTGAALNLGWGAQSAGGLQYTANCPGEPTQRNPCRVRSGVRGDLACLNTEPNNCPGKTDRSPHAIDGRCRKPQNQGFLTDRY